MRKEIKKAPTIRFQGFTDEWEQHKLGDVCNQLTGAINPQTRPNELFVEYSMPAYDSGMKPNIVYGFTMNSTRKIVNESCLLINKLNVRKKRIWYIKNPTKNTVCSAEFIPLCSDNIDLLFLNYVVSRGAFTNYLEDCSSGSSNSQKRVTPDIIIEAKVFLPVKDEQLRIGRYFQKIDNLITLHQRKLDQLKKLKKYFLQNLFPAKGEKVPRIRFKGFTGDWEQRKVGDVITEVSRPIELKDDQKYQLVTVKRRNEGIISRGSILGRDILVKRYFEIHSGDYLISKRQLVHGANGIVPEALNGAVVSNEYMVCVSNKNILAEFLALLSKTKSLKRDFFLSSYGVDIEKLVFDVQDWMKRSLYLPSLGEQEELCKYFQKLDRLIALHQRKLNQLQTMKKFMLQNLFTQTSHT